MTNEDYKEEDFNEEDDSNTDDTDIEETNSDESDDSDDTDYKAEAQKAKAEAAKYRRLFEKGKKAQGEEAKADTSKADGLDYGEKAFLNSLGYKDSAEQAFIEQEMKSTGKTLEQVTSFNYVQEKIDAMRTDAKNAEATPKSSKRGKTSTKSSVDYWIKKGDLPPNDQRELRSKVVAQKRKNAANKNKFGDGKYEVV